MTLSRIGGLAALICALTYLVGFALLLTVLAPLGFGSEDIDAARVVAYIADGGASVLTAWNLTIFVVNALALVVLAVALGQRFGPGVSDLTRALGLIWAGLVLGAGMIANVAVDRAALLVQSDPDEAARLWSVLHSVELGLGGGNEIAGGVWIFTVSIAAFSTALLPRVTCALGAFVGIAGLATVVAPLGEAAGSLFGLGAILWFVMVGWAFSRTA